MERGSTQHSARLDEALDADTAPLTHGTPHEGHPDESRWQEGPTDGEPAPDGLLVGDAEPSRFVDLGLEDLDVRSELARSLLPHIFPATGAELVDCALDESAYEWVIDALHDLPADGVYPTVQSVWVALGGPVEHRDHPLVTARADETGADDITDVPEVPNPALRTDRRADTEADEWTSTIGVQPARPGPVVIASHIARPALAFVARVVGDGLRATAAVLDAAGRKLGA